MSPSPTSSGPGGETVSEDDVAGEASVVVPGVVSVGGRDAARVASPPLKTGGPAGEFEPSVDSFMVCGGVAFCAKGPTRRGLVAVDAADPGTDAESSVACDWVACDPLKLRAGATFLAACPEAPFGDAADVADFVAESIDVDSPVCRALPLTVNELS